MTRDQFIEISKWQDETFGQATALSKMHHLAEEVIELIEALKTQKKLMDDAEARICQMEVKTPDLVDINNGQQKAEAEIRKEFADCFILLFGAAASHGYTFEEIAGLIAEKHRINKARNWGTPDNNGVVRHVKGTVLIDTEKKTPEELKAEEYFKNGGQIAVVVQNDYGTGPVEKIKIHPWDLGLKTEILYRRGLPEPEYCAGCVFDRGDKGCSHPLPELKLADNFKMKCGTYWNFNQLGQRGRENNGV